MIEEMVLAWCQQQGLGEHDKVTFHIDHADVVKIQYLRECDVAPISQTLNIHELTTLYGIESETSSM